MRFQVVPLSCHEDHDDCQEHKADPRPSHGQLKDQVVTVGQVPKVAKVCHRLVLLVGCVVLSVEQVLLMFRLEDLGVLNVCQHCPTRDGLLVHVLAIQVGLLGVAVLFQAPLVGISVAVVTVAITVALSVSGNVSSSITVFCDPPSHFDPRF